MIVEHEETERKEHEWREEIKIDPEFNAYRDKLISMVGNVESTWHGHVCRMSLAKHRRWINIRRNSTRTLRIVKSRAKGTWVWKTETNQMLKMWVSEPAETGWVSFIVLALQKDGHQRFCVYSRKLNAVTARKHYPIPRMDECIHSLGDKLLFSTFDGDWSKCKVDICNAELNKTAIFRIMGCLDYWESHLDCAMRLEHFNTKWM